MLGKSLQLLNDQFKWNPEWFDQNPLICPPYVYSVSQYDAKQKCNTSWTQFQQLIEQYYIHNANTYCRDIVLNPTTGVIVYTLTLISPLPYYAYPIKIQIHCSNLK